MSDGKVIVYTGNGKGKTTSALGLGFDEWANQKRVLILQFLKGDRSYGEHQAAGALGDRFKIKQMGLGFVRNADEETLAKHKQKALKALEEANVEISSGNYDIIILDEINYAIHFDLLNEKDVLNLIKQKPEELKLVLTGRYARNSIIALADEVYEMIEVKHHSSQGIMAVRGIEF